MGLLIPFADDELQANARRDLDLLIKAQRKSTSILVLIDEPYSGWWESAQDFLNKLPRETLVALSPDYESTDRLKEVTTDTKARIEELLELEPDLLKALGRFSDEQAVRILTIHKSKGLEFDSVVIMAVENEIFFGDQDANRCAFFVGVSRAKRRLVLTHADKRERPDGYHKRWDVGRSPQEEYFAYANPFVQP
jgi:superfamily I DNA/RNA helicase